MSGFRSWVAAMFALRSRKAVSGFRSWLWWKPILEPQDVACREIPILIGFSQSC